MGNQTSTSGKTFIFQDAPERSIPTGVRVFNSVSFVFKSIGLLNLQRPDPVLLEVHHQTYLP